MRRVLTVAGAGALMLFSLAFVLADQASANDGPLCAPASGFIPKLCVNLPLAASRRENPTPIPTLATVAAVIAWQPDVARRTDVAIEPGVREPDLISVAASLSPEPERAQPEPRAMQRVFDIDDLRSYAWGAAV